MTKKLTIVFPGSLANAYRAMAADEEAARAAHDWTEGLIGETLPEEDFSDWPGYPQLSL